MNLEDIESRLAQFIRLTSNVLEKPHREILEGIVEDVREVLARRESDLTQEIHY